MVPRSGSVPRAGRRVHAESRRYHFFDWEHDGSVDHVGLVASVFRGKVYTIEGNSGFTGKDEKKWKGICKRNGYPIKSKDIFGYGLAEK